MLFQQFHGHFGGKVRGGLVQQEHARIEHEHAPHGQHLPLSPAELASATACQTQQMVGFVRAGTDSHHRSRSDTRRFGNLGSGLVCGDADELIGHFAGLAAQRVERFYVWFADFAVPDSLHEFGESVIQAFPNL